MNIEDRTSIHIGRKNQFIGDPKTLPVFQDSSPDGQISSFQMEIEYLDGSPSTDSENNPNLRTNNRTEGKYPNPEQFNLKIFDPEQINTNDDVPTQTDARNTISISFSAPSSDDPASINTNINILDANQVEREEQIGFTQKETELVPSSIKIGNGEFKASPTILAQMRLSKKSVYQDATATKVAPSVQVAGQQSNSPDLRHVANTVQSHPEVSNSFILAPKGAKIDAPRFLNQEVQKSKSDVKTVPNDLSNLEKPPAENATTITKRPTEQIYSKDNNSHQLNSNKSHGEVLVKVTNPDAQYSTAQSPAQQIFEKIQKHIAGSEIKTSNISETPNSRLSVDPVTNTISVKLAPENLGTVDVLIKKLGERISIEIQTNNINAELALKSESNSMAKLLKESGLTLETLDIATNSNLESFEDDKRKQKSFNLSENNTAYGQGELPNTGSGENEPNEKLDRQDEQPTGLNIVDQKKPGSDDDRIGVYI